MYEFSIYFCNRQRIFPLLKSTLAKPIVEYHSIFTVRLYNAAETEHCSVRKVHSHDLRFGQQSYARSVLHAYSVVFFTTAFR
jgi:hypothetical protein